MRALKSIKAARPYRQIKRAEKRQEIHETLARAAFELHSTVGPSQTTVTAIAAKAGVQRLTVYRHFPTDAAIFAACAAHSFEELPPPDPEEWRRIDKPELRLRRALGEMYGYYQKRARLLANLERDAEIPLVAAAIERRRAMLEKASAILAIDWPEENSQRRRFCRALIGHVLDFTTWRSLTVGQRLRQEEALEAAIAVVKTAWRLDVPIAVGRRRKGLV